MTILLFVLLLTVVNSSATVQKPPTATDTVHNVTYIGNASNGVESFQGIRYGADTSGENRFKHPRPFTYLKNSVVNATTVSPACPQRSTESLLGVTSDNGITSESEDCLRLMITRPKGTPKDAGLPVMVWIYGGTSSTMFNTPNLETLLEHSSMVDCRRRREWQHQRTAVRPGPPRIWSSGKGIACHIRLDELSRE